MIIFLYLPMIIAGFALVLMPVVDYFFHRKVQIERVFEAEYRDKNDSRKYDFIWETADSKEVVMKILRVRSYPPFENLVAVREVEPGCWPVKYKD